MKKSWVTFFLALSIFFSPPFCAFSATKKDIVKKEKKLEDVKKRIRREKESLKTVSDKEGSILGEMDGINKSLVEKREELETIETSLGAIQKKIAATNSDINGLKKERKALAGRLKQRLKAMYEMRRGEMILVLFSSESSTDLAMKHKYLTMIMDSDSKLIDRYEKNLLRLKSEKAKLDQLYGEMNSARRSALVKKNEAEAVRREKKVLLASIRLDRSRRERNIKELEQAALDLTKLLNQLRPAEDEPEGFHGRGFAAMKGRLKMPVAGNVVSFYGRVRNPKFQTVTFNNGIIIEAPVGAPVRSIYDGKVIYVGWLKGYGLVLIIDNGGSYYTLFAHLSKALKSRGDAVSKGDEVGYVGDTGPTNSSGLYFEIRQRGVPRDPMAWLQKR